MDGGGSSPRESPRTPATRPDHQYTSGHAHHDGGCHSGAPDVDDDEAPGSADSVALAFKLKREAQSFATLLRAGAEGRPAPPRTASYSSMAATHSSRNRAVSSCTEGSA